MANRPAKNISSLASQMIVPTLTMFGLVRECTREVSKVLAVEAVVTRSSWHRHRGKTPAGAMAWRPRWLGGDLAVTWPGPTAARLPGNARGRALGCRS